MKVSTVNHVAFTGNRVEYEIGVEDFSIRSDTNSYVQEVRKAAYLGRTARRQDEGFGSVSYPLNLRSCDRKTSGGKFTIARRWSGNS